MSVNYAELFGLFFKGDKTKAYNTSADLVAKALMDSNFLKVLANGDNFTGNNLQPGEANPDFVSMIVELGHGLRLLDKSTSANTVISDLVDFSALAILLIKSNS